MCSLRRDSGLGRENQVLLRNAQLTRDLDSPVVPSSYIFRLFAGVVQLSLAALNPRADILHQPLT